MIELQIEHGPRNERLVQSGCSIPKKWHNIPRNEPLLQIEHVTKSTPLIGILPKTVVDLGQAGTAASPVQKDYYKKS